MAMYYNGKKVRNLYFNGKCITRLALGKEMTRLVEGDDFVRAQWLRAEVNVRASMASLPVDSTNLYFKSKRIRGSNFHYFSTNDYEYYCESPSANHYFSIWKYSGSTVIYRNTDIVSDEVVIDCSSDKIYVNGYEIPIYGYPISYVQFRAMAVSGMETLTSSITVDGVERYIPCRLLRPIPAALDANGIARSAGECGMYDSVSGKFYGNVASSGSFTVRLVEGVDYEVHDKLIVEDGRFALPLNSEVFECTIENLSNNNNVVILQASSRYTYHYKSNEDNTSSALTCWDLTQNTDVVGKYHLNNPSTFISDGTTFKCNGSNVTKYGFPPDSIDIRSSHSFKISISAITVDGIERYIPVKLLKSIPSKYDVNGIARNAGECGMYDTVNDKFYGNVASSGSFTVSDN